MTYSAYFHAQSNLISWGGIFPSSSDPPLSINNQENAAKQKINFHDVANVKKRKRRIKTETRNEAKFRTIHFISEINFNN